MKILIVIIFIFSGCSTFVSSPKSGDEFDKILYLKGKGDAKELIPILGEPEKIDSSDKDIDQYYFPKMKNQLPIKVSVVKSTKKISSIALTYWVGFDAYAYLRNRFKDYKWVETPIESKSIDVVEELYKVEIPEIGIVFQYNNQDPLRRPMWIFFK